MVTGIMAKACNYPFLVWKNTVQQGLPISLNPRIVYRGLPMACLNLGGTNAVQFGGTGVFQRLLATAGSSQDSVTVGGAFLGGAASGLPCSIWELCMIQQQRFGGSILGTPARFVREYGAAALSRGVTMTIGRGAMFDMSPEPPYCTCRTAPHRTASQDSWPSGGHCCTYAVRVPASGVPHVPRSVAIRPQARGHVHHVHAGHHPAHPAAARRKLGRRAEHGAYYIRLQPLLHAVTASVTHGYSLCHTL